MRRNPALPAGRRKRECRHERSGAIYHPAGGILYKRLETGSQYPQRLGVEIAIVGKSNVGKSSLINSLCNNYKLANLAEPGKTRLDQLFRDQPFILFGGFAGLRVLRKLQGSAASVGRIDGAIPELRPGDTSVSASGYPHAPTAEDRQMFQMDAVFMACLYAHRYQSG